MPASNYAVQPLCKAPPPGRAGCLAVALLPRSSEARAHRHPLGVGWREGLRGKPATSAAEGAYGFTPAELHAAYNLPEGTLAAPGQTIALIDAGNDPYIEEDLATYDREFGLPPCTKENGCLKVVNQEGKSAPLPQPLKEWWGEISLDVETAHGICEDCHILLVEANFITNGQEAEVPDSDLEAANRAAKALGATVISNSWGSAEPLAKEEAQGAETFNLPGVAVLAAAGDLGYKNWDANTATLEYVDYPAASPDVLAVGGTRLETGPHGEYLKERVWNGQGATGGGCAEAPFFTAPSWQSKLPNWAEVGCGSQRAVSDLAADADPYTPAAIYVPSASGSPGEWQALGGTSLATPLVAGAIGLAGGVPEGAKYAAEVLYHNFATNPALFHPVAVGSNGRCTKPFSSKGLSGCTVLEEGEQCGERAICVAGQGYNGPAGVGSPASLGAFALEGKAPEGVLLVNTTTTTVTTTVTATETSAVTETVVQTVTATKAKVVERPAILALTLLPSARAALRHARQALPARRLAFAIRTNAPDTVMIKVVRLLRYGRRSVAQVQAKPLRLQLKGKHRRFRLPGTLRLPAGRYRLVARPLGGSRFIFSFTVP